MQFMKKILDVKLPKLHTVSELNRANENRFVKQKRHKNQQFEVMFTLRNHIKEYPTPCLIKLTRIAPRKLDVHDNLPSSFKWIVDTIAKQIGLHDNDDSLHWRYDQEKGKPKEYAIKI